MTLNQCKILLMNRTVHFPCLFFWWEWKPVISTGLKSGFR